MIDKNNMDMGEVFDIDEMLNSKSYKRDPNKVILMYEIIIECAIFWKSRQYYFQLVKSFLAKEIEGETFCSKFLSLRSGNIVEMHEIYRKVEQNDDLIPDIFYTSKSKKLTEAIDDIYIYVDRFDPTLDNNNWDDNWIVLNESQLKWVIQERYLSILEESCSYEIS